MKTIRFFFALAMLAISQFIGAQDTLHVYAADQPILGKIIKIGDQAIEYRKSNFPDGPDFSIQRCSVKAVALASGYRETMTPCAVNTGTPEPLYVVRGANRYQQHTIKDYPVAAEIKWIHIAGVIGREVSGTRRVLTIGGQPITSGVLREVIRRDNARAADIYDRAFKHHQDFETAGVFTLLGGVIHTGSMALWVNTEEGDAEDNQRLLGTMALIGAATFLVGGGNMLYYHKKYRQQSDIAIQMYNEGLLNGSTSRPPNTSTSSVPSLHIGGTTNGLGMVLKF